MQEGIKFVTSTAVGKDIKGNQLLNDNDAVLLCTGSTRPRDLPVPGNYFLSFFIVLIFKKEKI